MVLAYTHYGKKEYDLAIFDFSRVLGVNTNHAEAHFGRGAAFLKKRQYDEAISDFSAALKLNLNDANTYNRRAVAYLSRRQYREAIADSWKAIEIDPKLSDAYDNLACIFASSKEAHFRDGKRAVELASRACELSDWKQPDYLDTLAAGVSREPVILITQSSGKKKLSSSMKEEVPLLLKND